MLEFLAGWTLGFNTLTQHPGASPEDNLASKTPGIYAVSPENITFGAYSNSVGKTSLHVGKTFDSKFNLAGEKYSLTLGLVTGYEKPLLPMIVPSVKIGNMRITYIPEIKNFSYGALTAAVEFKF